MGKFKRLGPLCARFSGKVSGAVIGGVLAGWPGVLGGAVMGHAWDRFRRPRLRYRRIWRDDSLSEAERIYFTTVCVVMGHLAKADGRVSKAEIRAAEAAMADLGLRGERKRAAIHCFQLGKRPDLALADLLRRFGRIAPPGHPWRRQFLVYQLAVVAASKPPNRGQQKALVRMAARLGVDSGELHRMSREAHVAGEVALAAGASPYAVLGIAATASEEQITRAYRRIVSRHHPDRLEAQGLPAETVRAGASRTHEAKTAYDRIRRMRGF